MASAAARLIRQSGLDPRDQSTFATTPASQRQRRATSIHSKNGATTPDTNFPGIEYHASAVNDGGKDGSVGRGVVHEDGVGGNEVRG